MQPEFVKLYFEKQYYNYDAHLTSSQQAEQYIIWDSIERKKESKQLYDDFQAFNLGHTFTILRNTAEGKESFNFAAKLGCESINHTYLQNLDLLKNFINYFNDKVKAIKDLQKGYSNKFSIDQQQSGYFTKATLKQINMADFSQKIATERFYLDKDHYLTKRELECLYWFAQGKTIEETAVLLTITPRTIKAHISNIKEKFACDNQFQLGMLFQQLNKLNI